MKKYKNSTIDQYLNRLASREPVPGGGSVAALTGALACGLLSMVTQYSLGKGKPASIEKKLRKSLGISEKLRKRLTELVDLDAQAYLKVVAARKKSPAEKKKAAKEAQKVPTETARLCFKATELAPDLVRHGNRYLLSDVQVAIELLYAAFTSALVNVEVNQ